MNHTERPIDPNCIVSALELHVKTWSDQAEERRASAEKLKIGLRGLDHLQTDLIDRIKAVIEQKSNEAILFENYATDLQSTVLLAKTLFPKPEEE